MLTTALTEAKGLVDPRFLLTALFPVLVFVLAMAWVLGAAAGTLDEWLAAWEAASTIGQLVAALVVVPVSFVLAMFVTSNMQVVVRLYSGDLAPAWLARAGTRRQQRVDPKSPVSRWPQRSALKPTRLGNVLAAAQEYPELAYGVDVPATWPRLTLLLPETVLTEVRRRLDATYFLLLVSLLLTVVAVVGGVAAVAATLGAPLYLALVLGGGLLAHLAYRGAVGAADDVNLGVRSAYDLYRNDLLAQLGRPLPATSDEEFRVWGEVAQTLAAGRPRPVRYVRAEAT